MKHNLGVLLTVCNINVNFLSLWINDPKYLNNLFVTDLFFNSDFCVSSLFTLTYNTCIMLYFDLVVNLCALSLQYTPQAFILTFFTPSHQHIMPFFSNFFTFRFQHIWKTWTIEWVWLIIQNYYERSGHEWYPWWRPTSIYRNDFISLTNACTIILALTCICI